MKFEDIIKLCGIMGFVYVSVEKWEKFNNQRNL